MEHVEIQPADMPKFKADITLDRRYIGDDIFGMLNTEKYDTFFIKSAAGTGKTTFLEKFIQIYSRQLPKIQIITSRISLTDTLMSKLPGFVDYRDKEVNAPRCIRSLDSLIYYPHYEHNLVIIDEFHSLMEYLTNSSTLEDKREIIRERLENIIMYTDYLVILDANLTDADVEYVRRLHDSAVDDSHELGTLAIHNVCKPETIEYEIVDKNKDLEDSIFTDVSEGRKIFITGDRKKQLLSIHKKLITKFAYLEDKIVIYYCDSPKQLRDELRNIHEYWEHYQVVMCTPTILYGVDYSKRDSFYRIYGLYSNIINPRSVYQQLRRIRHPIINRVQLSLFTKATKEIPDLWTGDSEEPYQLVYNQMRQEIIDSQNNYLAWLATYLNEAGGKLYLQYRKRKK